MMMSVQAGSRRPSLLVRSTVAPVLLATTLLAAPACGDESAVAVVSPQEAVDLIDDGTTVIDVRTPQEYAAGHVADAVNISVEAADFDVQVEQLDKGAEYVVYCRSGRRSGLATQRMAGLGFTDLKDAQVFDSLAAAGAPVEVG